MNLKGLNLVFCCPGASFTKDFLVSWTNTIEWSMNNGINSILMTYYSSDLYLCRNGILTQGTKPKPWPEMIPWDGQVNYDYLMWIDSDETWTPEDLERMLSHEKDIVSGVVPIGADMRIPIGYFGTDAASGRECIHYINGRHINEIAEADKDIMAGDRPFREWLLPNGLLETHFCGFGFLLVKKGVFEGIGYPWFTMEFMTVGDRELMASEDVGWCLKARKAGFKVYVDLNVRVGHQKIAEFTVKQ